MRYRTSRAWLVLLTGLLFWPAVARGQWEQYEVPPADPVVPLPLGSNRMELGGPFVYGEFVFLRQSAREALGDQTVAFRGIIDATGVATGVPGRILGSGREALNTNDLGRGTYQPGFKVGAGFKFESGFVLTVDYLHLFDASYWAGASVIPPFYSNGLTLADTFISSQVFNYHPAFNGPVFNDTLYDPVIPGTTVGIWNAADVMDIKFTQRYSQVDITGRTPLFQTEYARTYGLAGARFAWFHESFTWRTTDYDFDNFARPQDVAIYSNILSQRMYGPFVGCGHDVYVGDSFGLSLDLTAALLLSINKERAKYAIASRELQAKRSVSEYGVVPNLNAHVNLWWYPTEGIQMRLGYNVMNFFNTMRMEQPIGFNFGSIDPVYDQGFYRLLHGFNVGIALIF